MDENEISYKIRGAIFNVYNNIGPGLLESVYEAALLAELRSMNIKIEEQVQIPVYYKGIHLGVGFRADLVVDQKVIDEIKSVKKLKDIHHKQLLSYLRITGMRLGILVNFTTTNLTGSIIRIVNRL